MIQQANKAVKYNIREDLGQATKQERIKKRFWERGVAFPSKLVEDMQELEKLYQLRYEVYCL